VARETMHPLTPEEAKARLLAATRQAGPSAFTRRHPWAGVAAACLLGCLAGSEADTRAAARESLRLLLNLL